MRHRITFKCPPPPITGKIRFFTFTSTEDGNTPHSHGLNAHKSAFTLAEVLITLGIIGIIAALTLPSLIDNYQKQKTVTGLKKVYSELAQAVKLSEIDNGEIKTWEFKSTNTTDTNFLADKYIIPYLKNITSDNGKDGYRVINTADGTRIQFHPDGTSDGIYTLFMKIELPGYKKSDASSPFFEGINSKNTFYLNIVKTGNFRFYNTLDWSTRAFDDERDELVKNSVYGCNKNNIKPVNCGALIQYDGWEIKDDYPW